jgi:hypothetical protein
MTEHRTPYGAGEKKDWIVIEGRNSDTWLDVRDPDGWWSAYVKWDGCIGLSRYFNDPMDDKKRNDDDIDSIHICDIDETIRRLQSLKAKALEHFGDWPR